MQFSSQLAVYYPLKGRWQIPVRGRIAYKDVLAGARMRWLRMGSETSR
jgi:hypothetical protein